MYNMISLFTGLLLLADLCQAQPTRYAIACTTAKNTNWVSTGRLISPTRPLMKRLHCLLTLHYTCTGQMEALPTSSEQQM